jgi:hypothetical protein
MLFLTFIILGVRLIWHKDKVLLVGLGSKKLADHLTLSRNSGTSLFPGSMGRTKASPNIRTMYNIFVFAF